MLWTVIMELMTAGCNRMPSAPTNGLGRFEHMYGDGMRCTVTVTATATVTVLYSIIQYRTPLSSVNTLL